MSEQPSRMWEKYSVRIFSVSDEDYAIQRFYFDKIKEAGFNINNRLDANGEKGTYIDNFDFKDMPKLAKALDEDLIFSCYNSDFEITIYDLPIE
ncbi:hypothetical protein 8014-B2_0097 [Lactobacillus phage ATCC 8014-B2]|uniref:Uncharacterized protein n=1 Tax=Lactobacillus phage ATCC 8014-B2 TaxID=1225795 RepID=K4IDA4_9CAUD|nr:hypothetical protein HOQ89_gp049 [Lactobacillus phage ATCC 8014-B2]AFU63164.1 hypothetical protein 8014-B2_0097 [Lactobacillus phage ATCC 8014-B2]